MTLTIEALQVWVAVLSLAVPAGLTTLGLYVANKINAARDAILRAVKEDYAGRELTEQRLAELARRVEQLESRH